MGRPQVTRAGAGSVPQSSTRTADAVRAQERHYHQAAMIALPAYAMAVVTVSSGVWPPVPATRFGIGRLRGIAVAPDGSRYLAATELRRVLKVDAANRISAVSPGRAIERRLDQATSDAHPQPTGIAVGAGGEVYVAEREARRVRVFDSELRPLRVVLGQGASGDAGWVDLATPTALAIDGEGWLLVCDTAGHRVWRVSPDDGRAEVFAGTGVRGYAGDGLEAVRAQLDHPDGLAVTPEAVFIADRGNHRIRRVETETGRIDTYAGNGAPGVAGDGGPARSAAIGDPASLAVDAGGALLVAQTGAGRVRRIEPKGIITAWPKGGTFAAPTALAFDRGAVLVAEAETRRLTLVTGRHRTVIAGDGRLGFFGDGGAAIAASVRPLRVAVDRAGNVYLAEAATHRIRRLDARTGIIDTIAGTGVAGYAGDGGPAAEAALNAPQGVAVTPAGTVYVADTGNGRIRRIARGRMSTVFTKHPSRPGADASAAGFVAPEAIAVDEMERVFVADRSGPSVYRIDRDGTTRTLYTRSLGPTPARPGFGVRITDIEVDAAGRLLIAFGDGARVSRLDAEAGQLVDVLGDGTWALSKESGPARHAVASAWGLGWSVTGQLLVSDFRNGLIWRVDLARGTRTPIPGTEAGDLLAWDVAGRRHDLVVAEPSRLQAVAGGRVQRVAGGEHAAFIRAEE